MILYLDDNSYAEIAAILGISETNVATKISRIKLPPQGSRSAPPQFNYKLLENAMDTTTVKDSLAVKAIGSSRRACGSTPCSSPNRTL